MKNHHLLLLLSCLTSTTWADLTPMLDDELQSVDGRAGITLSSDQWSMSADEVRYSHQGMSHDLVMADINASLDNINIGLDVVDDLAGHGGTPGDTHALALSFQTPLNITALSYTLDATNGSASGLKGDLKASVIPTDPVHTYYLVPMNYTSRNFGGDFTVSISGTEAGNAVTLDETFRRDGSGQPISVTTLAPGTTSVDWNYGSDGSQGCYNSGIIGAGLCDNFNPNATNNDYIKLTVNSYDSQIITLRYEAYDTDGWAGSNEDEFLWVLNDDYSRYRCAGANNEQCVDINGNRVWNNVGGAVNRDGSETITLRVGEDQPVYLPDNNIFVGDPSQQYLMKVNASGSFNISGTVYTFAN